MNAPAPVVHWELQGPDVDRLRRFYGDLFGWPMQEMPQLEPAKQNYVMAFSEDGDHGVGGGFCAATDRPNLATFYVQVPDVAASLRAVTAAGGAVVTGVTEVPGVITFALFADPAGNVVGLVAPRVAVPPGPNR